jgi:hypothetical protein
VVDKREPSNRYTFEGFLDVYFYTFSIYNVAKKNSDFQKILMFDCLLSNLKDSTQSANSNIWKVCFFLGNFSICSSENRWQQVHQWTIIRQSLKKIVYTGNRRIPSKVFKGVFPMCGIDIFTLFTPKAWLLIVSFPVHFLQVIEEYSQHRYGLNCASHLLIFGDNKIKIC